MLVIAITAITTITNDYYRLNIPINQSEMNEVKDLRKFGSRIFGSIDQSLDCPSFIGVVGRDFWRGVSKVRSFFCYIFIYIKKKIHTHKGFQGSSDSKKTTYNAGDPGLIPGLGRSPKEGNGYPLQYSCLGNAMDRGAW